MTAASLDCLNILGQHGRSWSRSAIFTGFQMLSISTQTSLTASMMINNTVMNTRAVKRLKIVI